MRRLALRALCLIFSCAVLCGCWDLEQSVVLHRDLTGEAEFRVGADKRPLRLLALREKIQLEGKARMPTSGEVAAAWADESETPRGVSIAERLRTIQSELEKKLPSGVRLIDSSLSDDGKWNRARFRFGFTDLNALSRASLFALAPRAETSEKDAKSLEPFRQVRLQDEGETILVTSEPLRPNFYMDSAFMVKGQTVDDPEWNQRVGESFSAFRIAFRLQAPFAVVESNATRREGDTLFWEYDYETLARHKVGEPIEGIRVRYKK
jgi:hypothetical protein